MKITIIPPQYIPSLGKAAYFIGRYFKKQKHEVTIVTSNLDHGKPLREYDQKDPELKVIRLNSFEKKKKIVTPSLYNKLKSIDTDIFLATEGLATYSYYVAAKVAKERNIPLVLIADWYGENFKGKGLKWLYTKLFKVPMLNRASTIFVYDNTVKSALAGAGVKENKLHILPNGSDYEMFSNGDRKKGREILKLDKNDLAILNVGRVLKVKNFEFLIHFINKFKDKYKKLRLVIIGPVIDMNYYLKLIEHVNKLGLNKIVSFHHINDYSDLPHVYAASDIFAFTSKSEGYSLVIFEAMAAGLPIITTPVGAIPETINKVGCGFVSGHKDDYYNKLLKLIDKKSLREKLSNKAKKAAKKYSWVEIAKQIEEQLLKQTKQIFTMDLERDIDAGLRFSKLLKKYNQKGEFYISGFLVEKHPEACKEIAKYHEINGHGFDHEHFTKLNLREQEEIIKKTINIFRKHGIDIKGWRFPYLHFENKSLNILNKYNLYDSSVRENVLKKWGCRLFIRNWFVNLKNGNISFPSFIRRVKEKPWSHADLSDKHFYTKNGRLVCHCYNFKNFEKEFEEYLKNGLAR